MITRVDALTQVGGVIDRVFYATGVLLAEDDFRTEQNYHRARLARTLAYLHGSGTVAGLRVDWQPALAPGEDADFPNGCEERVLVQPGLAVDRLGRLIEVQRPACIRLNEWYAEQDPPALNRALKGAPFEGVPLAEGVEIAQAVVVDLFLRFVVCERGKTPAFVAGPFSALDAVQPSRLRDGYELEFILREDATPLPAQPWQSVDPTDVNTLRSTLHTAIFNAWREGTAFNDLGGLNPLPEHVEGQDPTALFLARLLIPATPTGNLDERPVRSATPVQVSNEVRLFVYTAGALTRWIGI